MGSQQHHANRSPMAASELLVTLGDCFQPGRLGPARLILAASARAAAGVGLVEAAADSWGASEPPPASRAPTNATMATSLVFLTSSLLSAPNRSTAQK